MAILEGCQAPQELVEFTYRDRFGLSYEEMMDEPLDKFKVNMEIMRLEAIRNERQNNG